MFKRPAIEWWKGCVSLNIIICGYLWLLSPCDSTGRKNTTGQLGLGLPHTLHEGTILEGPRQSRRSPCSASKSHHGPNQQMMKQKKSGSIWVNYFCAQKKEWRGWSGQIIHFPEKKTPFASISAWLPHTKTIISLAKSARSPSFANFEPVASKCLIHSP